MLRQGNYIKAIDLRVLAIFLVLSVFGWMNIKGASYNPDQSSWLDLQTVAGKQLIWIGLSLILGTLILLIDSRIFDRFAYVFYGLTILVLIATPFLGSSIKGSHSWISIGGLRFQPAEVAKCVVSLALAKYMSKYDYAIRSWKDLVAPCLLLAIPMGIIMVWQKETGSALVFASMFLMFYRQGMSGGILLAGLIAILLFYLNIKLGAVNIPIGIGSVSNLVICLLILAAIICITMWLYDQKKHAAIIAGGVTLAYVAGAISTMWLPINFDYIGFGTVIAVAIYLLCLAFVTRRKNWVMIALMALMALGFSFACSFAFEKILQPHQKERIEVTFRLKDDPRGAGYNVNQSKIAIGSGGFFGKGYLNGTQTKLKYVPEQHTDFIFCTVGEEWGFLGAAGVLGLYLLLILRIIEIAERQKDTFSMLYAYCVAGIFLMHTCINIGMVLGLIPVIGIPLPFMSYGGSSMLGFTILLFVLLRLDAARIEKM